VELKAVRILENPVVIVALIVLVIVLFGAKRLPDVAKSVGSSLKIFKKEVKDLRDGDDDRPASAPQGDASTQQQAPQAQAQPAPETVRPPANDGTTPSGSSSSTS
jgi:sec-independent protein translocase protein TatA